MSLRSRLILSSAALLVVVCLVLGILANLFATRTVERDAMREVGIAADGRYLALRERLEAVVTRNTLFLHWVRQTCGADPACAERMLAQHVTTLEIRAARLQLDGAPPVHAGEQGPAIDAALDAVPTLPPGQLAVVVDIDGARALGVRIGSVDGDGIVLVPSLEPLFHIFENRAGLGEGGETFLSDPQGYFLTPSRYPSSAGHSHPIAVAPMNACLAGRNGEVVDLDYRGVEVIHGYRYVPEIGGGCIMAHIAFAEAYAPVRELQIALASATVLVAAAAALISASLADQVIRPLERVTARARALAEGDAAGPFPETGPPEVRVLARTLAGMSRSLTETIARLRESNADLEAYNASVSHDLRAPLRAIVEEARHIAETRPLPADAAKRVARIEANAQRMVTLVDDLLAFSRAGRQTLHAATVRPAEVVASVLEGLADARAGRDVRLVVGELPPCVGDPTLIRQVYTNLLANALKFTRHRAQAVVEVGFVDGAYFVRDNGAGFDMRYASHLFEPFQRLHGQEEFEGTGVGLAIVRRIVERHGGRIWAEAEPDRGATFRFTLPSR